MKSNHDIKITISSDLDFENLIAEIFIDSDFIGLITNEPKKPMKFEIPEGQVTATSIDVYTLLKAINIAISELKTHR